MGLNYRFTWITPPISQKQIEDLFHWINGHLKNQDRLPLSHFSKMGLHPLVQPEEALSIQFSLEMKDPINAENFRIGIWNEVFSNFIPIPKPFAVSFVPTTTATTQKKLIAFDMDSTLINQEVIDELARKVGFYNEVAMITEESMKGNLSFGESLAARCKLLKGLSIHEAMSIIPDLQLSPGAESLLSSLRSREVKSAIVSGGFQFILRHFQKHLFMDHAYGNDLERNDDDQFTGEVLPPVVDAEYKQKLVANLKTQYCFSKDETIVVGDGANDLLMMKEAGLSVSFCGKPKLSAETNTLILDRNLLWILAVL